MSGTVNQFMRLVEKRGSKVTCHQEGSTTLCPCLTKQGYRDPQWHLDHPLAPVCNDEGILSDENTIEFDLKGWVQPVQSGAVRRLTAENLLQMFGEVKSDDQLGIFPCKWYQHVLNFNDWLGSQSNWIVKNSVKYVVVSANLIDDPATGDSHHWEVGLRRFDKVG